MIRIGKRQRFRGGATAWKTSGGGCRSVASSGTRTAFEASRLPSDRRAFLVFAGVDWEAEVWLNGEFLGRHKVYYEPFRSM